MDESRSLQGMSRPLGFEPRHGEAVRFNIDLRHKRLFGGAVACSQPFEENGNFALPRLHSNVT